MTVQMQAGDPVRHPAEEACKGAEVQGPQQRQQGWEVATEPCEAGLCSMQFCTVQPS